MKDDFPLSRGIPMHLLMERGLNEAFLDVVERHRRENVPVVVRIEGRVTNVGVGDLGPEIARTRNRIAELTAEISKIRDYAFLAQRDALTVP